MKSPLIVGIVSSLALCSFTFWADLTVWISTNSGNSQTWTNITKIATDLQADLDKIMWDLLNQLSGTVQDVQNIYDNKIKKLIDTSVFKAVSCMNLMNTDWVTVDVNNVKSEYQKWILEQYVELSADIKRYNLGLHSDITSLKNEVANFKQYFSSQLTGVSANYQWVYNQLKSDFEMYFTANETLLYDVSDKILKLDELNQKYKNLVSARNEVDQVLNERTKILPILESPRASVLAIFKGDLDEIIRTYQTKNPEIDFNKVYAKKDELITDFSNQLSNFLSILFGSDYPLLKYIEQTKKAEDFLKTYITNWEYQCASMISSPINRERTYLTLSNDLDSITPNFSKAVQRVYSWRDDQITRMEPLIEQVFVIYYNRILKSEKQAFNKFITQLIAETYYANQQSTTPPTTE